MEEAWVVCPRARLAAVHTAWWTQLRGGAMSDYKNVSNFIFFDGGRLLPIPSRGGGLDPFPRQQRQPLGDDQPSVRQWTQHQNFRRRRWSWRFYQTPYDRKVAEIIRRAILVVRPAVQRLFQRHENALNLCHSGRARVGCSEFDWRRHQISISWTIRREWHWNAIHQAHSGL